MSTPMPVKVVLRVLGGALVVALVLTGGFAMATQLASTERVERFEVDAAGLEAVVARTEVGGIRVEEVPDAGGRVEVEVRRQGAWRLPELERRHEGGRLYLEGKCHKGPFSDCSTQLVLKVPAGLDLTARSAVGDLFVSGEFARVSLESSTGDVTAEDLESDHVGVVSSVGDVALRLAAAADEATVSSSVGDVLVVVPDDGTRYDVRADTNVGERVLLIPMDTSSPHSIRVTSSVGDVRLVTTQEDQP